MKVAELFHVFSQTHPVAEPMLFLALGMVEAQRRNADKAVSLFMKGMEQASAAGMNYVEALVLWCRADLLMQSDGVCVCCTE
jgi:hypothetical protein